MPPPSVVPRTWPAAATTCQRSAGLLGLPLPAAAAPGGASASLPAGPSRLCVASVLSALPSQRCLVLQRHPALSLPVFLASTDRPLGHPRYPPPKRSSPLGP